MRGLVPFVAGLALLLSAGVLTGPAAAALHRGGRRVRALPGPERGALERLTGPWRET